MRSIEPGAWNSSSETLSRTLRTGSPRRRIAYAVEAARGTSVPPPSIPLLSPPPPPPPPSRAPDTSPRRRRPPLGAPPPPPLPDPLLQRPPPIAPDAAGIGGRQPVRE